MSKIKRLIQSYNKFISIPWRSDAAPMQRVIFCVYNENDELKLRARIEEFELVTKAAGHNWHVFDLTDSFANWLSNEPYAKSYFKNPELLSTHLPGYMAFITNQFEEFLMENKADANTVVAVKGVGSLFGFLKVKDVVDQLAPLVEGKLVVFFPGSYENNNYRLLDGYDGWNYLAVPITADKEY
ncbi:MAG: DUF1788 domain-containing protein [Desulfobacteraceae bacterium]|nr:DUF1788 domain-containing protein [Desulfobacteraceae bacterium]